jgi:hypothetical protein
MSDQTDFEALLPKLQAIDPKLVNDPDMPVEQAIKEGQVMVTVAREDVNELVAVKFDPATIDELETAVFGFSTAQANMVATLGEQKGAARQWLIEEPGLLKLLKKLLAASRYALRNVPDAFKAVKHIAKGGSKPNRVQDLADIAALGKKYVSYFEAINFDITLLDVAEQKAKTLLSLQALVFAEKSTKGSKDVRDRSFIYMRGLMAQVLSAAKYAFTDDPERLSRYYSAYRKRRKGKSGSKDANAPDNGSK